MNVGKDRAASLSAKIKICCWSFKFKARAFGTGKVSEWRRPRGGEDFRVVKVSEWWNTVPDRKCLRGGGSLDVAEDSG